MNTKIGGKHFLFIIGIGFLLIACIMGVFLEKKRDNQKPIATLEDIINKVERSGAEVRELLVQVKMNQAPFHNEQEARAYRQKMAAQLGLDLPVGVKNMPNHDIIVYQGETRTPEGMSVTFTQNFGKKVESSIAFTFKGTKNNRQELRRYITVLENVTKTDTIVLQFNTCVTGKFNGKLKNDLQRKKIQQVLTSFQGKVVETLDDFTVMSVSAYTPQIPFKILTNQKPMNLQVASHVDDYRNETTLTVGMPIITKEY